MEWQRQAGHPTHRVVTGVYVNFDTDPFWIIDYRIFAPKTDHKSKPDHLREMLANVVQHKRLPFRIVLMDTWYAAQNEMLFLEALGKTYYCPVREKSIAKRKAVTASIAWASRKTNCGRDGVCICATSLRVIR